MEKKSLVLQCALMVLVTLVLLWTVPATAADVVKADAVKNVYICGCGPACGCNLVAEKAGACPCGKPLIETQVLKEDADKVYVCACGNNCKCALNPTDPTRCACGKELRAYPKGAKMGCVHGMGAGGCDKPCDACPKKPDCTNCPKMPAAPK